MDVRNLAKFLEKDFIFVRKPVVSFGKIIVIIGIFEVIVVIAERDDSRGDGAKLSEPGSETFTIGAIFNGIERVDEIARN